MGYIEGRVSSSMLWIDRIGNPKWWLYQSNYFIIIVNNIYAKSADDIQGAVSIRKMVLPGMAIPMLKIRRPNGRLIFNMEIAIRR